MCTCDLAVLFCFTVNQSQHEIQVGNQEHPSHILRQQYDAATGVSGSDQISFWVLLSAQIILANNLNKKANI